MDITKMIGSLLLVGFIALAFTYSLSDASTEYEREGETEELQRITNISDGLQEDVSEQRNQSKTQNFIVKSLDDLSGGIFTKAISTFGNIGAYLTGSIAILTGITSLAALPAGTQSVIGLLSSLAVVGFVFGFLFFVYFRVKP